MTWTWEYVPDEEHVAGQAPPAFIAMVEGKADEIVRAAEALHLDGTGFEGISEGAKDAFVAGGMFRYLVIPGTKRVSGRPS